MHNLKILWGDIKGAVIYRKDGDELSINDTCVERELCRQVGRAFFIIYLGNKEQLNLIHFIFFMCHGEGELIMIYCLMFTELKANIK